MGGSKTTQVDALPWKYIHRALKSTKWVCTPCAGFVQKSLVNAKGFHCKSMAAAVCVDSRVGSDQSQTHLCAQINSTGSSALARKYISGFNYHSSSYEDYP